MTPYRRFLEFLAVLILSPLVVPMIIGVAIWILVRDGRPIFYGAERMKTMDQSFTLWKFRTMKPVSGDQGVSGGDKSNRITHTGPVLRRYRLDELPQLWNVVRGDISFVGPRPPLREYTNAYPTLYQKVLESRPGITGLATIVYHKTEERLLADCETPEETDKVYRRRCIPRKAHIDLIYQRHQSNSYYHWLMWASVIRSWSVKGCDRSRPQIKNTTGK